MQVSITDKPNSQKEIEVSLSAEEMKPHLEKAVDTLGKDLLLKGFRAGKAPADIVKQSVGEWKMWETAAEQAFQAVYPKVVMDNGLNVLAFPNVEVLQLAPGNDFRFRATVSILKDVVLPDFRAIAKEVYAKEHKNVTVEKREIQEAMLWIQKSRATYTKVARLVQKGDFVQCSYEGRVGGVKQEGLEAARQHFQIGEYDEAPQNKTAEKANGAEAEDAAVRGFFADFERQLVGMGEGEEKDFSLSISPVHPNKNISGKTVVFHAKVESVRERALPALDDEFAKKVGNFESLAKFEESIRDGITAEKEEKELERVRLCILSEIARKSSIEAPSLLLDEELQKMWSEFENKISGAGITPDEYLAQIKKTKEEIQDGWKEKAKERVEAALILRQIAKAENVEVADEEAEKRTSDLLRSFSSKEEAEKTFGGPDELRSRVRGIIRNEKVFALLDEAAKG